MDMRTPGSSGGVSSADLEDLKYVTLQEGQGIFEAKVFCEADAQGNVKSIYDVKEVSFGGNTKLGGVKSEDDFSVTDLDIANVKEIQIVNARFESKRYKIENVPEVFVLAKITFDNGAVLENILIPKKVQISAVEVNTGAGKAWKFANLSKIEFKKSMAAQNAVNNVEQAFKKSQEKAVAIKATSGHKVVKKIK
jgi:hypothetical protein